MLTREEVLDELAVLSTIEHALCVEYLFVACVLGHGRQSAADDGAVDAQIDDAAGHALNGLAIGEMQHLRSVNETLVRAGRRPSLGRATSVAGDPVAISFAPLSAAQLDGLLERDLRADADDHYQRILASLQSAFAELSGVGEAVGVMFALGELHIRLANHGLLPAFTLPRDYAT